MQSYPDIDFLNKMDMSFPTDDEAADETKGDSRTSPKYPRAPAPPKKKVTFHHTAFVVLIPTVEEYRQALLADQLWWNDCDFQSFKISAAREVKEFMKTVPHLDAKRAMKLYFQKFSELPEEGEQQQKVLTLTTPEFESTLPIESTSDGSECDEKEYFNAEEGGKGEEGEASEENRESDVCRVVQRHDSVTSSKLPKHHFGTTEQMDSLIKKVNNTPPAASVDPEESYGVSMDSFSVFARLMAVGVLVLMNRNNR